MNVVSVVNKAGGEKRDVRAREMCERVCALKHGGGNQNDEIKTNHQARFATNFLLSTGGVAAEGREGGVAWGFLVSLGAEHMSK